MKESLSVSASCAPVATLAVDSAAPSGSAILALEGVARVVSLGNSAKVRRAAVSDVTAVVEGRWLNIDGGVVSGSIHEASLVAIIVLITSSAIPGAVAITAAELVATSVFSSNLGKSVLVAVADIAIVVERYRGINEGRAV